MLLIYYCDTSFEDFNIRLSVSDIWELNAQFNTNLLVAEPSHDWFDSEELPVHMRVCDEAEIFNLENYGVIE